jgi:hypothetical protein
MIGILNSKRKEVELKMKIIFSLVSNFRNFFWTLKIGKTQNEGMNKKFIFVSKL